MTMSVTLSYSRDPDMTGATTVDLMASGCIVNDGFYPKTPGDEDATVVEEIPLWITGTGSQILAIVRSIEVQLELAAASLRNYVYLNFKLDSTQTEYRSRVLGGSVIYDGRLDKRWRRARMKATALVRREVVWEGPETALSVANQHGSGTSGVTVHWRCDSTHDNWVEVDAAVVGGTLPGPARIEATAQATSAAIEFDELHIHNGWRHAVATPYHVLEAENAGTKGTDHTDADYSGGKYNTLAPTAGVVAEGILAWVLDEGTPTGAQLRLEGDLGRFLLTVETDASDDLYGWLTIGGSSGSLWTGPKVLISTQGVYGMGVCEMPPAYKSVGEWYGNIGLNLYTNESGVSVDVDCLSVAPVDSYAYMNFSEIDMSAQKTIVVDGIVGRHYLIDPSTSRAYDTPDSHGYIFLQPGVDNRLYFGYRRFTSNAGDATGTMTIKVYYRPRRRTL